MLKGKTMIVLLAVGLDWSNYATKDLKNAVGADTSDFVEKNDLVNLNSNVDKLDIGKLKNVTNDLSNLNIEK